MKRLLLLLFIASFYNCSEDETTPEPEPEFDLTASYSSTKVRHGDIEIFNASGPLNLDTGQFLEELEMRGLFSDLNSQFLTENSETILSESEKMDISFHLSYAISNSVDSLLVKQEGNLIRLKEIDTVRFLVDFDSELIKAMGTFQPEFSEYSSSAGSSIAQRIESIVPEIYGLTEGDKLVVPRVEFAYYGNQSFRSGGILNQLNPEVFSSLRASDTLIVQQNWIVFEN